MFLHTNLSNTTIVPVEHILKRHLLLTRIQPVTRKGKTLLFLVYRENGCVYGTYVPLNERLIQTALLFQEARLHGCTHVWNVYLDRRGLDYVLTDDPYQTRSQRNFLEWIEKDIDDMASCTYRTSEGKAFMPASQAVKDAACLRLHTVRLYEKEVDSPFYEFPEQRCVFAVSKQVECSPYQLLDVPASPSIMQVAELVSRLSFEALEGVYLNTTVDYTAYYFDTQPSAHKDLSEAVYWIQPFK